MNGNTHKERLLNLCALVSEDGSLCSSQTNIDALLIVGASSPNIWKINEDAVVGHCNATLISERSSDKWYTATCEKENDDGPTRWTNSWEFKIEEIRSGNTT